MGRLEGSKRGLEAAGSFGRMQSLECRPCSQAAGPGGKLMVFAVFPAAPDIPVFSPPAQPQGAGVIVDMKGSSTQRG